MKRLIIIFAIVFSIFSLNAIFKDYTPSVAARGMGGAYYSSGDDVTSIFYNPACLVLTEDQVKFGYTKLFNENFMVNKTFSFSYDIPKFGKAGFAIQAFDVEYLDVDLMSEKVFTLAHSFKLLKDYSSELYFGYTANMYTLDMKNNSNASTFGLNLGMLGVLYKRTKIGFAITNLNKPEIGKSHEELPQKMAIGVTYVPYDGVKTSIELKKEINSEFSSEYDKTEIHSGLEVVLFDALALRAGIRNNPYSLSFGLGIDTKSVLVDYAYNTHSNLNGTHHISVGYQF